MLADAGCNHVPDGISQCIFNHFLYARIILGSNSLVSSITPQSIQCTAKAIPTWHHSSPWLYICYQLLRLLLQTTILAAAPFSCSYVLLFESHSWGTHVKWWRSLSWDGSQLVHSVCKWRMKNYGISPLESISYGKLLDKTWQIPPCKLTCYWHLTVPLERQQLLSCLYHLYLNQQQHS